MKLEEDSLVTVMSPMSIYNDLPVDLQVHLESSAKSMVTRLVRSESSTQIKQFDLLHSLVMSLQIKNTQKSERVVITSATTKTIFVQIPIKPSPTVLSPLRVQLKCTPRTIHISCAVILENPYDLPIQVQSSKGGVYEVSSRLWIAGHEKCSLRVHTSAWRTLKHIVRTRDLRLDDTYEKEREFRVYLTKRSEQRVMISPYLIITNLTSRNVMVRKGKNMHRLESSKNFIVWWCTKKEDDSYRIGFQESWSGNVCLTREMESIPILADFVWNGASFGSARGTFVASLEDREMIV